MAGISFGNPYTDNRLRNLYFNAPPPQTLQAPKRTLGQLVNDKVSGALTPVAGKRMARKLADLVDYSPVGAVAQSFDAGADIRKGNYIQGAVNALLNVIPDGGGKLGGAVAHSIIAPLWHGSPHKFEKFALEKIGTGEGAQAYGHGLYFAENPEVAKQYADDLVAARATKLVGNVDLTELYQLLPESPSTMAEARRDFRQFQEMGALGRSDRRDFLEAVQNNLSAKGHLYQVKLDANPEDFLDWDAPLAQQPDKVRQLLPSLIHPDVQATRARQLADGTLTGPGVYHAPLSIDQRSGMPASEAWRQAGVPGLRYFDQGSRDVKQGSRNYVVFDPSIIDITNRY